MDLWENVDDCGYVCVFCVFCRKQMEEGSRREEKVGDNVLMKRKFGMNTVALQYLPKHGDF